MKPENLPIGAGIFIERAADLDGSSPTGLDTSKPKISAADFNAYIDTLPRAQPVSTEGKQDKGAAEPVCLELEPAAAAALVDLGPDPAGNDSESPVSTGQTPVLGPVSGPPEHKSEPAASPPAADPPNGPAPDRAPAAHTGDARAAADASGRGGGRAHAGAVGELPVTRPRNF